MFRTVLVLSLFFICFTDSTSAQVKKGWQNLNQKWSKDKQPETPKDLNFERDVAYRKGHDRWVMNIISPKEKSFGMPFTFQGAQSGSNIPTMRPPISSR